MTIFDLIKKYYIGEHYTKEHIANLVAHKVLTPEQYKDIVGEDYPGETT